MENEQSDLVGASGVAGDATTRITAGMSVYDSGGERVGTIEQLHFDQGYVAVKAGHLFGRDLYIPLDAVARAGDDGLRLKVAKHELDALDWYLPPTNGVDLDTPYSVPADREAGYGEGQRPAPPAGPSSPAEATSQLASDERADAAPDVLRVPEGEERLAIEKRQAARAAHVRTEVQTEQRSISVPIAHDELRVERVAVSGAEAAAIGPDAFTEKDIEMPLMGEQVELEKHAHVAEEVVLRKQSVTQERTFSGTVRRERVREAGADDLDISDQDTIAYDRLPGSDTEPTATQP
ncbi:MAG: DUF2382 domain-containing protein [Ktedonobacterales bacterium]